MADFVVSTVFKGRDQVSQVFKAMGTNADKFGKRASRAFRKSTRDALSFKKIVGGILTASAVQRGITMFRQGVGTVVEEFIDFDQAITSAAAKFPVAIDRGTKEFERLGAVARKVGAETQFTAADAAKGLNFLAMAGFNASQAMAALPRTVDLATAAEMDLSRTTDIATDALGAFGLMSDDVTQRMKNLDRINDVFARTITSANVDMEQLFDTMKMAGPVTKTVGSNLETFAAMAGLVGSAGLKGTIGGTTLRQTFISLAAPTKRARTELKKLRIQLADAKGDLRDPVTLLGELAKKTEKLGSTQRTAALDAIFGKRAIAGVSNLLDLGGPKIDEYRQKLEKAGGASQKMAEMMRKSIGNRLAALKSSLIEVGFRFIDAFEKKVPGALDKAIAAVRKFDVAAVIDGIKKFRDFMLKLFKIIKDFRPLIVGLVAALITYKAVMIAITVIEAVQFFFALTRAIKGAAIAQGFLNAMFMANPVAVIVTAVGLLVTGLVLLIDNWDLVKRKVIEFATVAKVWIMKVWSVISDMLESPFFVAVGFLIAPWLTAGALLIKSFQENKISWNQFVDAVVGTTKEARQIIVDLFVAIGQKFIEAKQKVTNVVNTIGERISTLLDNPFFTAAAILLAPWITIPALIVKHWKPIAKVLQKIVDTLARAMPMMDEIQGVFGREKSKQFGLKGASVFGPAEERRQFGSAFGRIGTPNLTPEAPNKTQVEVAEQKASFEGRLEIAGAPPGSSFKKIKSFGAPKINVEMLGLNP